MSSTREERSGAQPSRRPRTAAATTTSAIAASARVASIDVEPTRIYTAESARDFLAGAGLGPEAIAAMDGKFASAFVRARKPRS